MTTYNAAALADSVIAFKKGITLQQGRALRDNPLAMFEGSAGAPNLAFRALDELEPGSSIRSRIDAADTQTATVALTIHLKHSFSFLQTGTIRVTLVHRATIAVGQNVNAYVYRTRAGVSTAVASWATSSTSGVARSADIDVLPGDILTIAHQVNANTGSELSFQRFQTNGQNLWPGSHGWVEGNTV